MQKRFGTTTILVFGGAGFVGSEFIRQVLSESLKTKIVCVDALTYAGNRDNLKGLPASRFTFIQGDITDASRMGRIFSKYKPSYVINFAAESHVDKSIHGGAEAFVRTNVLGTTVLLEALRQTPTVKKFVQVSTDEVYGSLSLASRKKFIEQSPLAPNSPYAASKAAADLVARSYHRTYALPIVITRCSNNYGPYQHPEKLIPYSITRLMEGKPIVMYGDGKYVRDWIHVTDHCSALVSALLNGVSGEIYNIGVGEEVDNLTIARRLLKYFKKGKSALVFVKDRPGHDRRYAIDSSKIRRELGWKSKHTFGTSFEPTIAWYVENTAWTRRALARSGVANMHI
ncbi:dTDP-glucose 4,6-dehydratase [Candidatus Kaiserbacteria bacterium]|nr:dTDP-glucose 4,6-dehydratase [Candidatus Kaiserbacteria bacterium]